MPVYPRFRGRHKLHRFEDTGLEKCVGCSLCAAACPADCIRVVAAENTPENRVSAGERYAAVYEINMSRCIFCGYCEVACPFDAITMGHDYELSDYNRSDLIFTKEMLLAEPLERTPLRTRASSIGAADGRRSSSSSRRIGAIAGAVGVVALRNPFYSVLALVFHLLSLAALFLLLRAEFVAAAQVIVYAGAVMVLYVFVVSYVGGADEPIRRRAAAAAHRAAPLFAGALFAELCIAVLGSRPEGHRLRGRRPTSPASARPRQIGELLLTKFLLAVRGRLAPAAGRRRRRGHPGAPRGAGAVEDAGAEHRRSRERSRSGGTGRGRGTARAARERRQRETGATGER